MKKLYFLKLCFLLFFSVNAQIVTITDPQLKSALVNSTASNQVASVNIPIYNAVDEQWFSSSYQPIDSNGDGEIQLTEAQAVKFLKITNITCFSTTGLEAFSNLQYLNFSGNIGIQNLDFTALVNLKALICSSNNGLTNINVSGLTNLLELNCYLNNITVLNISGTINLLRLNCNNNELTTLNIAQCVNLQKLDCYRNNISNLNLSSVTNLKTLNCGSNNLTILDVSNLINLQSLGFDDNQITTINVSQNVNLKVFVGTDNFLTSLNLSGLNNLEYVDCGFNQLTNLNVSGLASLQNLNCTSNPLSSLDLTGSVNLTDLTCMSNELTSLNVSGLTLLEIINCPNNLLTSLNISSNLSLILLRCNNNQLTTLDITNNKYLQEIDCQFNQLQNLFLKNNPQYQNLNVNFDNNPNLQYICANEFNIPFIEYRLQSYGYSTTCQVNSYCTFNPGGTFYTIQGNNRLDSNNNGCDTNDINYQNLKFNITDGTNSGTFISNSTGNYTIPVSAGTHIFTPQLENPTYFNISPTTTTVVFPATASPFTQNFCVTPNGIHHDLEISIIPVTVARPGFDATYKIKYKNKGNQVENASVNFHFNQLVMDLVSSSVTPTSSNFSVLNWTLGTLNPFQQGEITLTFNLNSPTESPALNAGTNLNFVSNITSANTDETQNDNSSTLNQIVVNSFDPNDKRCLEGTSINSAMIGQYLHYMIRFENTGTFPAENIVVKDMIDVTKFDISSLQMTDASHPCFTRINGNKVEFIFENINLDFNNATNDGYVVFKIKTVASLPINAQITNMANIYLDYNFPITTNTETSNFTVLNNDNFNFTSHFTIYPNPVKDILNITSKENIEISSISIYTILGQIIQTKTQASNTIDVSELKTGNYFLKITSDKGTYSTKFIKQ